MPASQDLPASPLFRLPGELRNTIYRLVLASTTSSGEESGRCIHHMPHLCGNGGLRFQCHYVPPTWLNTCRQMRDEVSGLYYSETVFSFHSQNVLMRWLKSLPTGSRTSLTTIRDAYPRISRDDAEGYLARLHREFEERGLELHGDSLAACFRDGKLSAGWIWTRGGVGRGDERAESVDNESVMSL